MPDEAITEGANVLNNLTAAAPAWGALAIVLIIMGVILFLMQKAQNNFICKMQKRSEEREDKIIDFVSNYATTAQSDTDAVRELSKTISDLNRDCRDRFNKECDSGE